MRQKRRKLCSERVTVTERKTRHATGCKSTTQTKKQTPENHEQERGEVGTLFFYFASPRHPKKKTSTSACTHAHARTQAQTREREREVKELSSLVT
jgi:ABC-type nickel/cobalt efflux system permease component RcnA